jgi:hypothetical protein
MAEEGRRYRRPERLGPSPLVEARRVAPSNEIACHGID